jgi:aminoglycoside 6'-N-acetyltransferase I
MSKQYADFEIEMLSMTNLLSLTEMSLELWPESDFEEELASWKKIITNSNNYCALAKSSAQYAGFIHITIRNDFVEGADSDKTAYLKGIFVKPENGNKGIANLLFSHGEQWAKSSGLKQLASDTEIRNEISQWFHKKIGFEEVNRIVCFLKNI